MVTKTVVYRPKIQTQTIHCATVTEFLLHHIQWCHQKVRGQRSSLAPLHRNLGEGGRRRPCPIACSTPEVGGWPLGCEEQRWWANCLGISFQDFRPIWSSSTNVTDRQTDRRMTCNLSTALCTIAMHYSASRSKTVALCIDGYNTWIVFYVCIVRGSEATSNTEAGWHT